MFCQLKKQTPEGLQCINCDWVYRGKSSKTIEHTCRNSEPPVPPTLEVLTEQIYQDMKSRLSTQLPAMIPEITRRASICYSNPCKKFNGHLCTDRGSVCTCWKRWMERLAIGQCGYWIQDK